MVSVQQNWPRYLYYKQFGKYWILNSIVSLVKLFVYLAIAILSIIKYSHTHKLNVWLHFENYVLLATLKIKQNKTGVVNDPLGQPTEH